MTVRMVKAETLNLRVSPRFKFGLELLARKRNKSLTTVVMESVEALIREELTMIRKGSDGTKERVNIARAAWDPVLPDRLTKLALIAEDLLTDEEKVQWKVIRENREYWHGPEDPHLNAIRNSWSQIQRQAKKIAEDYSQ